MIPRAIGLLLLLATGCSDPLDQPGGPDLMGAPNVTFKGDVQGSFAAVVRAIYNQPSAPTLTTFTVIGYPNKTVGVDGFAVDAVITGRPQARHYDEMQARMSASVRMLDGRLFTSNVNSMNRIDIVAVPPPTPGDRGAEIYQLRGAAAGIVTTLQTSDAIQFEVDF